MHSFDAGAGQTTTQLSGGMFHVPFSVGLKRDVEYGLQSNTRFLAFYPPPAASNDIWIGLTIFTHQLTLLVPRDGHAAGRIYVLRAGDAVQHPSLLL